MGNMIAKIHNIRAVGKFNDFSPCEPLELGNLTLIYSDNGLGKSTLADIFRSLTLGDANRLVGRKTLKSDHDQLVNLELENEDKLIFANNKWHGQSPNVKVFDDVFICENVCTGNMVGSNQNRNLAQVIIGDAAVRAQANEDRLKADRDKIKDRIEVLQGQIREHIYSLEPTAVGKLTVDEYVDIAKVTEIDEAVEKQDGRVSQVEKHEEILNVRQLGAVTLPTLPLSELRDLLGLSLEQVEGKAEQKVREHFSRYSDYSVEDWIERGTHLLVERSEFCPFCDQRLSGSQLIQHYQSYFNQEYMNLKKEISDFAAEHLEFETVISQMHRQLLENTATFQFWRKQNLELDVEDLSHEEIKDALDDVARQLRELVKIKKNRPLERLQLNGTAAPALNHWSNVAKKVENYNGKVNSVNKHIANRRESLEGADLGAEKRRLIRLRHTKRRYSPDVADLCERYKQAKLKSQEYEQQISETREDIDKAIDDLFVTYKDKVNEFLESLGAEFTIGEFARTRDKTSVRLRNYGLVISGEHVDVGNPQTPVDEASFKNTMSAGDRRSLAFAYFLAQLRALPDLDDTIVVFDDPMTSLDTNRRAKTINAIRRMCDVAKQVIIMSHDAFFLHEFWGRYSERRGPNFSVSNIQICAAPGENKPSRLVDKWDIEAAVRDREAKNYRRILDFAEGRSTESDLEDVSRCARILLERRCRMLYLDICQNANTLGNFMECVVQKRINSPELSSFNQKVKETINFLNPSHHDNLTAQPKPSETETRDYCNDVLKLLGRL